MKNNTAIILLFLSVGISYSFTNSQYQDVKELQALSNKYSETLENAAAIVELRDRLLVTYKSMPQADIDRINKALPDKMDTVRLALDLDGMASRYGVTIKSVQTSTEASSDPNSVVLPENAGVYDKAIVTFNFISNYENFTQLVTDLEKNLRIMDIKSLSFQAAESGLYEHHVSVETYWLK